MGEGFSELVSYPEPESDPLPTSPILEYKNGGGAQRAGVLSGTKRFYLLKIFKINAAVLLPAEPSVKVISFSINALRSAASSCGFCR